ncbi:hypothetical protein DFQ28_002121 [Apophysomyces sp. BC1034]|nr:hypothetical protein DFQ30_010350 [Apophysomyces sp. BC1015]KAG0183552.1 hypothetical protein DFQ29_002607 [Apophysomyces sp. BC1021]KAG0194012.1 hypothetical protein DFQ28_002121 [Apophysomyces sp. BC1034]
MDDLVIDFIVMSGPLSAKAPQGIVEESEQQQQPLAVPQPAIAVLSIIFPERTPHEI